MAAHLSRLHAARALVPGKRATVGASLLSRLRGQASGHLRIPLATLWLTTACGVMIAAVEQTGSIEGFAHGEGKAVEGVEVVASGPSLQGERRSVTDADGQFRFYALPPGTYRLRATARDRSEGVEDGIEVRLGRTTRVEIELVTASIIETVTVRGDTPLIDLVRTTSQQNFDRQYLEHSTVGIEGRRYQNVLGHAPGTVGGYVPRVRGSSAYENSYLIDGVETVDPYLGAFGTLFIQDAIEEIQFQTGGFPAELGRATGGISNVLTKSGGNRYSGSVDFRYGSTDMMEGGGHFEPDTDGITTRRLEATFGGPILKDRLWFFLAGSDARVPNPFAVGATSSEADAGFYLGKLTWRVARSHDLTVQASGGPVGIDRVNLDPLVSPEATDRFRLRLSTGTVRYAGFLRPELLVNAQASTFRADTEREPQSGDLDTPSQIVLFTGAQINNGTQISDEIQGRDQVGAALTWAPGALSGRHTFKFGFDYQSSNREKSKVFPGGELQWVVPDSGGTLVPYLIMVQTNSPNYSADGWTAALFAQDQWRVSHRVTLNLGLREEAVQCYNQDGRRVFETRLLQPRLGVAWDVSGDGRSALKFSASRYMHPGVLAIADFTNRYPTVDWYSNELVAGYLFGLGPVPVDLNGNGTIEERVFTRSSGGNPVGSTADGGRLDAPNVIELSASYERRLGAAAVIGLTLVQRETNDILETVIDPADVEVLGNVSQLDRRYRGAELRFEGHWPRINVVASYTLSRSEGHVSSIWGMGSGFDEPEMSVNRYGYLDDDARHMVKLHGFSPIPAGFEIGYGFLFHTGFPYTAQRYLVEEYGYGYEYLEPRGSRRLPSYWQLDLEGRKRFDVGVGNLSLILSVLNVFNQQAVVDVSEVEDSVGEPLLWQQPRRIEAGLRYAF